MLDIFVAPSGMPHANRKRTEQFIEKIDLPIRIERVNTLMNINKIPKMNPYYGFMFDVEFPDKGLRNGLGMFLRIDMFDYLVCYKKNVRTGYAEFRPRFFRENVKLELNQFTPANDFGLKSEDILNGFILEHGYEGFDKAEIERLIEMAQSRRKDLYAGRKGAR